MAGKKPLRSRAARRAAFSVEPPTSTIGGDAGFGVTRIVRPRHVKGSPVHACRITPTYSSRDRKSTRLNSSHGYISYAVFCLKKKKKKPQIEHMILSYNTG